jgi:hypothetical protein
MILRALTNGAVIGSNALKVASGIIGGVLITTDNTNAASVVIYRSDGGGNQGAKAIFSISTKTTIWVGAPFTIEEAGYVLVVVSGTGASAQIYEWVN